MCILVQDFSDIQDLAQYAPDKQPFHPPKKSEVAPMKVLFKDEKFTSETIDILSKLVEDGNLKGNCRVGASFATPYSTTRVHVYMHEWHS